MMTRGHDPRANPALGKNGWATTTTYILMTSRKKKQKIPFKNIDGLKLGRGQQTTIKH